MRIPVSFDRPVETTTVSGQNQARVTTRLLRFIEDDTGVNIVVPQNSIWYIQNVYVRSVHSALAGNRLLTYLHQRRDGLDYRNIWRWYSPMIAASQTMEVFAHPTQEYINEAGVVSSTYLAYRSMAPNPYMDGDELNFIETGHLAGDYVEVHLIVNEVTQ